MLANAALRSLGERQVKSTENTGWCMRENIAGGGNDARKRLRRKVIFILVLRGAWWGREKGKKAGGREGERPRRVVGPQRSSHVVG